MLYKVILTFVSVEILRCENSGENFGVVFRSAVLFFTMFIYCAVYYKTCARVAAILLFFGLRSN